MVAHFEAREWRCSWCCLRPPLFLFASLEAHLEPVLTDGNCPSRTHRKGQPITKVRLPSPESRRSAGGTPAKLKRKRAGNAAVDSTRLTSSARGSLGVEQAESPNKAAEGRRARIRAQPSSSTDAGRLSGTHERTMQSSYTYTREMAAPNGMAEALDIVKTKFAPHGWGESCTSCIATCLLWPTLARIPS